jgi:hypothetical protein
MLQYALNDAKSVIYIFLVLLGLYLHLTGDSLPGEDFKEFYENIQNKFSENIESSKKPQMASTEEMKLIMVEICMRCHELVKLKLRDSYLNLSIILNNN